MDLFRYWEESPPVHELVAAYLGYKGDNTEKPSNDFGDLFPGMVGVTVDQKLLGKG